MGSSSSKEGPDFKPSENRGRLIKGLVAPTYDVKQAGPPYSWAYKELQEAQQPDVLIIIGTANAGLKTSMPSRIKTLKRLSVSSRSTGPSWIGSGLLVPECFAEDIAHHSERHRVSIAILANQYGRH